MAISRLRRLNDPEKGAHCFEEGSFRGGNNLSWLRRFAVSLLKRHPVNDSLRGKMLRCLMNLDFLTEVLTLQRV